MKGTARIAVALLCIVVLLISAFGLARASNSVQTFQVGNMAVSIIGGKVFLQFSSYSRQADWSLFSMQSGKNVQLSLTSTKRIDDSAQNSVVVEFASSHLKVAEIYSFTKAGIDASIAVKNVAESSTSIVATFSMVLEPSSVVYHAGTSASVTTFSSSNAVATLSQTDSELTSGLIHLGWASEGSIFHTGVVVHSSSSNVISLPFGPLSIAPNETYTIDPTVAPYRPIGGGNGSPPQIDSLSVGNLLSVFENGTRQISIDYTISNMNGNSYADVGFFAVDASNYYHYVGGQTVYSAGSHSWSFKDNLVGRWLYFVLGMYYQSTWNYEGSAGPSFIVFENTAYPYDYPNSGYVFGGDNSIYSASGVLVGKIFGNFFYASVFPVGYPAEPDILSGVAVRNNQYLVNQVGMYLNYTGNSLDQTPYYMSHYPQGVEQYPYESSYQNYQNGSWSQVVKILWVVAWAAATAATDGAASVITSTAGALNPFNFLSPSTLSAPSHLPLNMTWTRNAGYSSLTIKAGYTSHSWKALGTTYGSILNQKFKPSYIFWVGDSMAFKAADSQATTPYVVEYMQYSMYYAIYNSSQNSVINGFPSLYTGSYSVTLYLPEAVQTVS